MFDTHCHLNFKAFKKTLPDVIARAHESGITNIVIPGTDVKTSKKAVEIAQAHKEIYAALGIHPHHAMKYFSRHPEGVTRLKDPEYIQEILRAAQDDISEMELLLSEEKVVAVGEIGMDRHMYEETVYENYAVNDQFVEIQKELLKKQIDLAKKYNKSLIFHNREAKADVLSILNDQWDAAFEYRAVFHCCEPDTELLDFAKVHKMFLGVDGDITYYPEKQEFIKQVPVEMLVLETDSPFLLPEPLKTERKYPNEPKNIAVFIDLIADLKKMTVEEVIRRTTANAHTLFGL